MLPSTPSSSSQFCPLIPCQSRLDGLWTVPRLTATVDSPWTTLHVAHRLTTVSLDNAARCPQRLENRYAVHHTAHSPYFCC